MFSQLATPLQKIHVRNLFKIFIPLRGENNFGVKINTTPVFGAVIYDKNDPSVSYEYQLQMLLRERNYTQGIETESEVVGCFGWAKRNAVSFQTEPNSNILEGVVLRLKVVHGIFDFRKTTRQLIRIVVNLHSSNQYVHQGTSALCKLLPKRRKADKSSNAIEPEIAIAWPGGETRTNEQHQHYPSIETSTINISPRSDSSAEVYESPEIHQIADLPPLFEQPPATSTPMLIQEVDLTTMFDTPTHERHDNNSYMVLYNGNAEVVGNFRALNFYKASDINIKEDIRLLMEDHDPRSVIMSIDGVQYKFKDGVRHSTNKRFVGYIAQQIESVVPEAVQLIDGILHVDYESLIPYLSESIKQNFDDIQHLRTDTDRLESLLNDLYDQFTRYETNNEPSKGTSRQPRPKKERSRVKVGRHDLPDLGYLRWQWIAGLLLLILVGITITISVSLVFKLRGPLPDETRHTKAPSLPHTSSPEHSSTAEYESMARTALKEFYQTMNGEHWKIKTNWMSDKSVCLWHGVICKGSIEDEEITEIHLSDNNLTGGLNGLNLISNVMSLKVIDLSKNQIGNHLSTLSRTITHLNLAENNIMADIKVFNQLVSIESLNLAHNRIFGEFKLEAYQLSHLKELNMSDTSITSIAPIVDGDYDFEVCDFKITTLYCPIPDWIRKCGGTCF